MDVMAASDVPPYHELLWPTLQAVTELGGSASIGEIVETVIKHQGFSDAQQAVLHNDGPETEIGYRLAWARSYLKGMGLLTNSARGIWSLTDEGTALVTDPAATDSQRRERTRELWQAHLAEARKARKTRPSQDAGDPDTAELTGERGWKELLLDQLMDMPPDAFERLAQRLLREADFNSVNVTGKSGDGGIDGLGVYRLGLGQLPGGRSRSHGPPARRRSDEPRGGGGAQFVGTAAVGAAEKRGPQFPAMCWVCSRPGRPDYAVLVSGTEPTDG